MLVDRARSGDNGAFDALCRASGDRLYRQAILLGCDPGTAEDLVQETLIAAWRSLDRFHGGCRFHTWLCSILFHRHGSLSRKWQVRRLWRFVGREDRDAETPWETEVDPCSTPAVRAEESERARILIGSLRRLPVRQREVVYLRFYADETLEGISAAVGCSIGTVKSRLFHGLERIRRMQTVIEHRPP